MVAVVWSHSRFLAIGGVLLVDCSLEFGDEPPTGRCRRYEFAKPLEPFEAESLQVVLETAGRIGSRFRRNEEHVGQEDLDGAMATEYL